MCSCGELAQKYRGGQKDLWFYVRVPSPIHRAILGMAFIGTDAAHRMEVRHHINTHHDGRRIR